MLVVEVRPRHRPPARYAFTRHTLGLGRPRPTLTIGYPDADLAIDAVGARASIALVENDGCLLVFDGRDARGTPRGVVAPGDSLPVGDVEVAIVHFVPLVPRDFEASEGELLRLLDDPADVGARLVYADVLEEGGWLIRAEYLRIHVRLALREPLPGDDEAASRIERKLVAAGHWVERVGRPRLLTRCNDPRCPVPWSRGGKPSTCTTCQRAVAAPRG